ncbi:MAG: hypothetical protein PHN98_09845 [Smithellaceae bacterium]|nr:hypothetical protein [Smithellaceae bacterium]
MPKNNGWVKLHRKLADNELWLAEPFTRGQAWIDLLLLANHRSEFIRRRGIMVKVERGQVAWSEEALARRWRWSKGKLRRFFSELSARSMISRQHAETTTRLKTELKNTPKTALKKTSVNALIYIENYERYQGNGTEDRTEEKTKNGTEEAFLPIIEEIKKRERRKTPTLPPEDFSITDKMREYAKAKGYTGDLESLKEKFLNYHRAKGSKFASWESAFKNWVLKEIEFNPPSATDARTEYQEITMENMGEIFEN